MTKIMTLVQASSRDLYILVGVVFVLALLPLGVSPFLLSVGTSVLIFALAGVGWNVLSGFAGQFSFGHAAYFGLGSYTVAILLTKYSISPWIGLIAGGFVAAIFGLLVGWVSFRFGLKGAYFALATFAVAEMLRLTFNSIDYFGAGIGITIPLVDGDDWARIQFSDTRALHYWFALGLLAVSIVAVIAIKRSRIGSYMFAVREDEDAASALGIDPLRTKLIAISISGFITALAGGYFTLFFLFIDPDVVFGPLVSVAILLRPIVGGVGTIWGPVVGAAILSLLGELTRTLVREPPAFLSFLEGANGLDQVLFGFILIVMIIRAPDGVLGWFRRKREKGTE
ncbi:MAG: branched-chain amino acid ABC transporter permease [Actinomycetia bacterium]|nr:branched-chain amino acid ABC transporter permease [Actinomycetes bacterium]